MSRSAPEEEALDDLDREILAAHSHGDGRRLARLYCRAAQRLAADKDPERAAFLFVNAYVWALESGEEEVAERAHGILVDMKREE